MEFPDRLMHSVNVKDLDFKMSQIIWQVNNHSNKEFSLEDQSTCQREKDIETIVLELSQLASSDEGKYFAEYLKLKYWSRCVSNSLIGILSVLRSKLEIFQRFYFIEGQEISIEEAYRFLLNRWMEKQQSLKRRSNGSITQKAPITNNSSSGGKGLLTKKRKLKTIKLEQ